MNTTSKIPAGIGKWVALVVAAVIAIWAISSYIGTRNNGVDQIQALNAEYPSAQNELATYINGFYEMLGVANAKSAQINSILTNAIKARYTGTSNVAAQQAKQNQALFSAVREAYPNLSGLNIYDKIVNYVAAKRDAYKNKQNELLDMLQRFDAWRNKFPTSLWAGLGAVPMGELRTQVGNDVRHGQDAEDKMWNIVRSAQSNQAYESGQQGPLTVPSPTTSTP